MSIHAAPFLRFIVPFVLGLAIGGWLDVPLPGLGWGLMVGAAIAGFLTVQKFAYRYRWVFGVHLHLLLFAFGYFHIVGHNEVRQPGHFSSKIQDCRYVLGTVYEAPSKGAKMKVPMRVEAIGTSPDSLQNVAGNIILFLEITSFTHSIRYGDRLGFRATVRPTEPPKIRTLLIMAAISIFKTSIIRHL